MTSRALRGLKLLGLIGILLAESLSAPSAQVPARTATAQAPSAAERPWRGSKVTSRATTHISAAKAIGLDPALLANRPPGPPDEAAVAYVRPMVEKASLALCVNEAWAMLACVAIAGVLLVPFARDRAETKS